MGYGSKKEKEKEEEEKLTWGVVTWKAIVAVVFWCWSIATGLYRAYGITLIWGWFIMGFVGLPALPLSVAIGVSFLMSFLTTNTGDMYSYVAAKDKIDPTMDKVMSWLWNPLMTTILIVGGWIWTFLVPFFGI